MTPKQKEELRALYAREREKKRREDRERRTLRDLDYFDYMQRIYARNERKKGRSRR